MPSPSSSGSCGCASAAAAAAYRSALSGAGASAVRGPLDPRRRAPRSHEIAGRLSSPGVSAADVARFRATTRRARARAPRLSRAELASRRSRRGAWHVRPGDRLPASDGTANDGANGRGCPHDVEAARRHDSPGRVSYAGRAAGDRARAQGASAAPTRTPRGRSACRRRPRASSCANGIGCLSSASSTFLVRAVPLALRARGRPLARGSPRLGDVASGPLRGGHDHVASRALREPERGVRADDERGRVVVREQLGDAAGERDDTEIGERTLAERGLEPLEEPFGVAAVGLREDDAEPAAADPASEIARPGRRRCRTFAMLASTSSAARWPIRALIVVRRSTSSIRSAICSRRPRARPISRSSRAWKAGRS